MTNESTAAENVESTTRILSASPVAKKDAPASNLPTVYLTDGELLPLKGYWFRVRLREIDGEKIVSLEKHKATAAAVKRADREARWMHQHPRSQRASRVKLGNVLRSLREQLSARA